MSYDGQSLQWNSVTETKPLPPNLVSGKILEIVIQDASGQTLHHKIKLTLNSPHKQTIPGADIPGLVTWTSNPSNPTGSQLIHVTGQANGYRETLKIASPSLDLSTLKLTVRDASTKTIITEQQLQQTEFSVEVPPGKSYEVIVKSEETLADKTEYFDLRYEYARPSEKEYPQIAKDYVNNFATAPQEKKDWSFLDSTIPAPARSLYSADVDNPPNNIDYPWLLKGAEALRAWLKHRVKSVNGKKQVEVLAYASYEGHPEKSREKYNFDLSQRRLETTYAIIDNYNDTKGDGDPVEITNRVPPAVISQVAFGQRKAETGEILHGNGANGNGVNDTDPTPYPPNAIPGIPRIRCEDDRVTVIKGTVASPGVTLSGRFTRQADTQTQIVLLRPFAPFPPSRKKPDLFRKLKLRVRIERNIPVLLEISGKLDFETELEKTLRANSKVDDLPQNQPLLSTNANPEDGVIDFTLTVSYDTATRYLSESLKLHSDVKDKDGLWTITHDPKDADSLFRVRNALGSIMVLSPILVKETGVSSTNQPSDWGVLAIDWAVPATLGGLNFFQTKKIVLYGGELKARQYVPPGNNQSVVAADQGVLFDYGVEFDIDLTSVAVPLKTKKPLRVRYQSVGFNVHTSIGPNDQASFQTIFDPSKGYEIDLSDPSLFDLDGVLGDLIKVLGARIAQFNPLTLELELGLNVDLGIVTVDRFLVKWPIAPLELPMILPCGVKVNLPATLKGSGYVHITDNGFKGGLDVTLVPIKLRIAANLAVEHLEDVTAVFASLVVGFPSPIVLGATGLGIYSLSGLFAMHYKRLEDPRQPGNPVGPALGWLQKSQGKPTELEIKNPDGSNNGNIKLWGPEKDRWSFGVGAVLGTLDGGFLDNLMGMLILELPEPRILICVKMQIITTLPGLEKDSKNVTAGILGVLDIDIAQKQVTLGVVVDFSIKKLLTIHLPVELFFDWQDTSNWHLFLGEYTTPASADILGIVHGSAYFMISGKPINTTKELSGLNVAGGISASIVFGSKPVGLYVEVYARADFGVAFSPFFIAGILLLRGELNLWVISIEVSANLLLEAPPGYFYGKICGKVDLFFFDVEGCIEATIGEKPQPSTEFPQLVTGVYLQSFSPVIASGQGSDRPIDASLGNAIKGSTPGELPVVPIDSIPVIQMLASPLVGASKEIWENNSPEEAATFTETLSIAPGNTDGKGSIVLGPDRFRFRIEEIALYQKPAGSNNFTKVDFGAKKPPVVWRKTKDARNDKPNKQIELAINSRAPFNTPFALERSTELTTIVETTWSNICIPATPPAAVLWTFCDQPLGFSGHGWYLNGVALPDAPGTSRESGPDTSLFVGEFILSDAQRAVLDIAQETKDPYPIPAEVVGKIPMSPREVQRVRCSRALQIPRLLQHKNYNLVNNPVKLDKPQDFYTVVAQLQQQMWVTLNTGASKYVRLYLLAENNWRKGLYQIVQLGKKGVLSVTPLDPAGAIVIQNMNQLPSTWRDSNLPWVKDIQPLYNFFNSGKPEFKEMTQLLVEISPHPDCIALQLQPKPVESPKGSTIALQRQVKPVELEKEKRYTLLVGAVEVLSRGEVARAQFESEKQKSIVEKVNDYLEFGDPVAMLKPNSEYRLDIKCEVTKIKEIDLGQGLNPDSTLSTKSQLLSFHFKTDEKIASSLEPWVLGTAPDLGDNYHFYSEPIFVIFNNKSVPQMFEAYNAKLQYQIRSANGAIVIPPKENIRPPNEAIANVDVKGGPNDIKPLSADKPASYVSPFYDTLRDTVRNLNLICLNTSGKTVDQPYVKIAAELKPLMDYTFDILPAPIDSNKPLSIQKIENMKGDLPFFRRRFRTSRYANIAALAADVNNKYVRFKALNTAITGLPATTAQVADRDLAEALIAAGEEALPVPQENRLVLYWYNNKPYAVLIETVEPVWRKRIEPELKPVQTPGEDLYDPNFQQVVWTPIVDLEMIADSDFITNFIIANNGTRTLAFINPSKVPGPDAPSVTFNLNLHRPKSDLYSRNEETVNLSNITLSAKAPWEGDSEIFS